MTDPLALAPRLDTPADPLAGFISSQLTKKNRELVRQALAAHSGSPDLGHGLQEELNRLLPRADLYSPPRFAAVTLPEDLKRQAAKLPRGDKLIEFNRALLERAFPEIMPSRHAYPYRPGWGLTLGSVFAVVGLVLIALRQTRPPAAAAFLRQPWLAGLGVTAAFVVIGFIRPNTAPAYPQRWIARSGVSPPCCSRVSCGARMPLWTVCGAAGFGLLA